jgi:hypothetical protein
MDKATEVRRYEATAAHHERIARVFKQVGRDADAASALKAAALCRANADKLRTAD